MMEHHERDHEKGTREFLSRVAAEVIPFAAETKKRMLAKGKTSGHRACPREGCGGRVSASIAGKHNHIRLSCDNPECYFQLIE